MNLKNRIAKLETSTKPHEASAVSLLLWQISRSENDPEFPPQDFIDSIESTSVDDMLLEIAFNTN